MSLSHGREPRWRRRFGSRRRENERRQGENHGIDRRNVDCVAGPRISPAPYATNARTRRPRDNLMTKNNQRITLLATSISFVLVILDTSIVNVALESISQGLATDVTGLQWIATAYIVA